MFLSILECRRHEGRVGYFIGTDDVSRAIIVLDDPERTAALKSWPTCEQCGELLMFFAAKDTPASRVEVRGWRVARTWN